MNAQARGKAFLGFVSVIKKQGGTNLLEKIISAAGPTTAEVFASRIWGISWHPYDAFRHYLQAINTLMGEGDPSHMRSLGAAIGKVDLGTIFKAYTRIASASMLIKACKPIWSSYYKNAGKMFAVSTEADNSVVHIEGFPQMEPLHCRLMEGWMASALESIGLYSPDMREVECASTGSAFHTFHFTWRKL